jgi:hypothetical protein
VGRIEDEEGLRLRGLGAGVVPLRATDRASSVFGIEGLARCRNVPARGRSNARRGTTPAPSPRGRLSLPRRITLGSGPGRQAGGHVSTGPPPAGLRSCQVSLGPPPAGPRSCHVSTGPPPAGPRSCQVSLGYPPAATAATVGGGRDGRGHWTARPHRRCVIGQDPQCRTLSPCGPSAAPVTTPTHRRRGTQRLNDARRGD